ncbi:hypothetical protein HK104_008493 [Borealophlyctis nickersoniae]|nr:hypothetical protein HK104_008493 [Borealophlyctis nickersoniae]
MLSQSAMSSTVTVFVSSEGASSERRFDKAILISTLKERLEPITGVPASTMRIDLFSASDEFLGSLQYDDKMLGFYPVENFMRLQVVDMNPHRIKNEFNDLSRVEKYEMPETEYEKRTDSVRAFKQRHKIGRFADKPAEDVPAEPDFAEEAAKIHVGDRCEVEAEGGLSKRGTVKFVGTVKFKPGYWVGISYDEPLGKHNGTVQGESYFTCQPNHGACVRPNKVTVGDFPEEDFDDLDEM